ncbi:MAG: hydantoinase/oxoprolinase family protein [Chloroflexota bacterium]
MRLAVDVGGTFVDFVRFDDQTGQIAIEKVPSSGQLEEKFLQGATQLGIDLTILQTIVHGSTIVINTIVQERGAKVGLVTTTGFRDVLELGRGNRPEIYNLFYKQPEPLVPRYLRYEVTERLDWRGEVLTPLDETAAREAVRALIAEGVEAIAICFLHAYANPTHERQMKAIVEAEFPEGIVCISSDIVREWREFERTSTTVLNAYAQPQVARYLSALEAKLSDGSYGGTLNIMQSSGGITTADVAKTAPIRTIQSGPAGGVIATVGLGETIGLKNLVSADVGGTTFDVALIVEGKALEKSSETINRRPILQPSIDIVSIGAGGGSIAWIDAEGGLRIGPHSAQADPGPVCFGLGGTEPTVTDAQVVLGYLNPYYYLGERMTLDKDLAARIIDEKIAQPLGLSVIEAANGIIHLTNMNMALAMRQITIERGHDPRDFACVSFGGGGGLFTSALLQELEMQQAIVPQNPAIFSAWGLLNADFREDLNHMLVSRMPDLTPADLAAAFAPLEAEAQTRLTANQLDSSTVTLERFADCRYQGQEHTVTVPVLPDDLEGETLASLKTRFDTYHEQAYAHALPTHEAEIVNIRLRALGVTVKPTLTPLETATTDVSSAQKGTRSVYFAGKTQPVDCPVYDREKLKAGHKITGPAIIEEWTSTILILPAMETLVDPYGNLMITELD